MLLRELLPRWEWQHEDRAADEMARRLRELDELAYVGQASKGTSNPEVVARDVWIQVRCILDGEEL